MTELESQSRAPVQPGTEILVLGATSLIGRFLLPRLAASGYTVTALSRDPPPGATDTAWVHGDLSDPALAERLPSASAIVSLSPIWLLPDALPALVRTGAKRLIAFSSTSRLTKIASPVAEERIVAERLAGGEKATIQACDEAQIAWTLFRPTLIYAEGQDRNVSRLAALIRRVGVLPLSGAGEGLRQPVHAKDLAEAVLSAFERPQSFGRIYALPGGETLSYRHMVERVFEALGRKPRILIIPPKLWRLGLGLAGPLLPGATVAMGERMSADLIFDLAPAALDLDWAPRQFKPDFARNLIDPSIPKKSTYA